MTTPAISPMEKKSALAVMGNRYSVDPNKLLATLQATCFKNSTQEEMMALVIVANQYGLNPFTKEIYAFPAKGGGIQPVVGIDGWIRLMNEHPMFDGIDFEEKQDDDTSKPLYCTAIIYRKDRSRPCKATEWFSECYRKTDPWDTKPRRMLRHKALIQCARIAFGFGGITDEDEAEAYRAPEIHVGQAFGKPSAPKQVEQVNLQPEVDTAIEGTPEPSLTPQEKLSKLCETNEIPFDIAQKWLVQSGNAKDAESLTSWADLDDATATRLLRAPGSLMRDIKKLMS